MRLTTDYTALFTPFELAGKRLRNRIAHASMTTLSTPVGRVTERLIQYHANRASGGAALTVTEPLGMMRHQAGLPRVQVWRRDDADGLKRFAEAVECQDCRLLGQIQDAGRGRQAIRAKEDAASIPPACRAAPKSWALRSSPLGTLHRYSLLKR
jgi:dimethylglycine catabolism A